MTPILLARSTAVAAAYTTAYLAPGTNVAATAALALKALNCVLIGHYVVFGARAGARVVRYMNRRSTARWTR
jgi:hypothetical protein